MKSRSGADHWVETCAERLAMRWTFLDAASAASLARDLGARPGWIDRDPVESADAYVELVNRDEPSPPHRPIPRRRI